MKDASKSFATAICEALNNMYPDREAPNKAAVHQLVTEFWFHDLQLSALFSISSSITVFEFSLY
jgi:hypothetical protein